MSLRETQQLMWTLIAAPEGVADGLRQIDKKSADLERVLRGDARLNAVQRLDIYANMYFFRLYETLLEDYPALRASIGDQSFYRLCTDYVAACPSQHPSVRNVGARMAAFLRTHPLGLERPWLAPLAALERARREVFDGPDADVLTLEELRTRPTDSFASLELPLVPSRAWVRAEHAIDDVWAAAESLGAGDGHEHGEGNEHGNADGPSDGHSAAGAGRNARGDAEATPGDTEATPGDVAKADCAGCGHRHDDEPRVAPPAAEPRTLLVWRQGFDVYHRAIPPLEQEALARLETGATFGSICDLVCEHMSLEEAGPAAFQLLATWVQDGLIARP